MASTHETSRKRERNSDGRFMVLWLAPTFDNNDENDCRDLQQLREITENVVITSEPETLQIFLKKGRNQENIVILSSFTGQALMPELQASKDVHAVYILSQKNKKTFSWTDKFRKIKGVYPNIQSICSAIEIRTHEEYLDLFPISFISSDDLMENSSPNQLDPSFMYVRLFKETLLEMDHGPAALDDFKKYFSEMYETDKRTLDVVLEFVSNYRSDKAIEYYTTDLFIYRDLNKSLRSLDGNVIVNMGFFIRDLHRQIEQLHMQQFSSHTMCPLTLYRGQMLSQRDFEKLMRSRGGLIAFNSFLSTSGTRDIALHFIERPFGYKDFLPILFIIRVDPSSNSVPFANIRHDSKYKDEDEILFSMYSVFRTMSVKNLDILENFYQVELISTSDTDPALIQLEDVIRQECGTLTGWQRLGHLLIFIGQLQKAEQLYQTLINQTTDKMEKALYYSQLGYIKDDQEKYYEALKYYENALEIERNSLPSNDVALAVSYNNIALVHYHKEDYLQALSFFEMALDIQEENLPDSALDVATTYNNIGLALTGAEKYDEALLYHDKALEMKRKKHPDNHPSIGNSYNNIALVLCHQKKYREAIEYFGKALEVYKRAFPFNHPSIITAEENMAEAYKMIGNHQQARHIEENSRRTSSNPAVAEVRGRADAASGDASLGTAREATRPGTARVGARNNSRTT